MSLDAYSDDSLRRRFLREAHVLARLSHPNIVPIYDLVRDGDGLPQFYTMKLVKGRTLQAILNGLREGDAEIENGYGLRSPVATPPVALPGGTSAGVGTASPRPPARSPSPRSPSTSPDSLQTARETHASRPAPPRCRPVSVAVPSSDRIGRSTERRTTDVEA